MSTLPYLETDLHLACINRLQQGSVTFTLNRAILSHLLNKIHLKPGVIAVLHFFLPSFLPFLFKDNTNMHVTRLQTINTSRIWKILRPVIDVCTNVTISLTSCKMLQGYPSAICVAFLGVFAPVYRSLKNLWRNVQDAGETKLATGSRSVTLSSIHTVFLFSLALCCLCGPHCLGSSSIFREWAAAPHNGWHKYFPAFPCTCG